MRGVARRIPGIPGDIRRGYHTWGRQRTSIRTLRGRERRVVVNACLDRNVVQPKAVARADRICRHVLVIGQVVVDRKRTERRHVSQHRNYLRSFFMEADDVETIVRVIAAVAYLEPALPRILGFAIA